MAGLILDPWEEFILRHSLGIREDGKWAAFEVAGVVPRQNGKGAILEARELVGLYLLDEALLIHSAHQFDTSLEHFRRVLTLIESTPDFDRRVKRVSRSHGEEGIELKGGQRIRFRTRTKGGGRGFTGDCVIFDEAMEFHESAHGAILPTLSARSVAGNPQVWYMASAVDQWIHDHGRVLARLRQRGIAGSDPSLAYFEHSVDRETPDDVDEDIATDPEQWGIANPGLGIRISAEHIALEQRSMDPRTFAVERLGVGDWPSADELAQVISAETWKACADAASSAEDPVCIAFDVTPDRSSGSIGVAGRRSDGKRHVEVIDRRRGALWIPDRLAELVERHEPAAVLCDGAGPAAALVDRLAQLGVEVVTLSAREYAQACGSFFDDCDDHDLRHLDTADLNGAVKGAAKRPLGDAWAWSRKSSTVDISPLVACTVARWGLDSQDGPSIYEDRGLVVA